MDPQVLGERSWLFFDDVIDLDDLGSAPVGSLRYISRPFGDRIEVNRQRFGLPFGKAALIKEAIARARVQATVGHPITPSPPPEGPYIDSANALENLWLTGAVPEQEPIIAW